MIEPNKSVDSGKIPIKFSYLNKMVLSVESEKFDDSESLLMSSKFSTAQTAAKFKFLFRSTLNRLFYMDVDVKFLKANPAINLLFRPVHEIMCRMLLSELFLLIKFFFLYETMKFLLSRKCFFIQ